MSRPLSIYIGESLLIKLNDHTYSHLSSLSFPFPEYVEKHLSHNREGVMNVCMHHDCVLIRNKIKTN